MADTIQFNDFIKVEMRVGMVTEVKVPDWSEKLLEFRVNLGEELGERTVFSAVRKWYGEADFLNKKFPFVANLAERKMGPAVSQGMMMMIDAGGNDAKPVLIILDDQAQLGAILC
jgi:methionyl-tRNA synthetase